MGAFRGGVFWLYRGKIAAVEHPPLMLTRFPGFFWTCLGLVETWVIAGSDFLGTCLGLVKGFLDAW